MLCLFQVYLKTLGQLLELNTLDFGRSLWTEAFVIYFNVFFQNLPGADAGSSQETEEIHENLSQNDYDSNQAPSKQLLEQGIRS